MSLSDALNPMATPDTTSLLAAQKAHSAGDLQAAERLYRKALAQQPDSFDALNLLGVVRAQQGQYQEAKLLIAKAVALDPRHAGALSNLGNVLSELGRPQEASTDVPWAPCSTKNDRPTPIRRPSASGRPCRFLISAS